MTAWVKKLGPRSPTEAHRVSTPLELFFDLVFVVAINFAASALHHDFAEDHIRHGLISYAMVIFAISWAWINFAWFASAYDNGDVLYRIAVFVQMTGALILAAGIERAFTERDIKIVVVGYVIMRLALVSLWIRAAFADPAHRSTDLRYALGIILVQLAWIALGFSVNEVRPWMFVVLVICELSVPVIAERGNMTTWHPEHIGERYGLFTIIVLGEAVLASALAIQTAVDDRLFDRQMLAIVAGSLVILYMMWWIYFEYSYRTEEVLTSASRDFSWGYGHIVLWGAVGAVGVGIGLCIDFATHHTELTRTGVQAVLGVAVTVYLISLWLFHDLPHGHSVAQRFSTPFVAALVMVTIWLPYGPVWMALLLVGLAAFRTTRERRHVEIEPAAH
jgi:low temperature requirement protein LtrA